MHFGSSDYEHLGGGPKRISFQGRPWGRGPGKPKGSKRGAIRAFCLGFKGLGFRVQGLGFRVGGALTPFLGAIDNFVKLLHYAASAGFQVKEGLGSLRL